MATRKRLKKKPTKAHTHPRITGIAGHGTGGATGPQTDNDQTGQQTNNSDLDTGNATIGSPDLTSATTTANPPTDTAADQADNELQAFFSSGVGPAYHYDLAAQQASSQPVQSTTGTSG